LLKRNLALKKLTDEYEIAKEKVRKYRREKSSTDNKENVDNTNSTFVGGNNVGHLWSENEFLKKSKIGLENEIHRLKEELSAKPTKMTKIMKIVDTNKDQDDNAAAMLQVVRREMSRLKNSFVRAGSEKALSKAKTIYSNEMKRLESTHNQVTELMRKRLEELADFLEALLSNGFLDLSLLSTHVRDSLARSLNESRRLSMSFAMNASMAGGAGDASGVSLAHIQGTCLRIILLINPKVHMFFKLLIEKSILQYKTRIILIDFLIYLCFLCNLRFIFLMWFQMFKLAIFYKFYNLKLNCFCLVHIS
jgi:hypothetical protein